MSDPKPTTDYTAEGVGAEHFEAPAVFYLTHAEAIERWHGLRSTAISATSAFIESIIDDFEPPPVAAAWTTTTADTGSNYRHHLIVPDGCPAAADGTPSIAVCFGWHIKRVWLTPSDYSPFVGIRVGGGNPGAAEWREEFLRGADAASLEIRKRCGYRAATEWPAWKEVPASGPWWQSLDGYRQQVLSELDRCVNDFAREIDRTVAARTSDA